MKNFIILLVIIFILTSCIENTNKENLEGTMDIKSINELDNSIICNESLRVLPVEESLVMKFLRNLSFGQKAYAVYPASVDPLVALDDYTYQGKYYAQNTHDYLTSVKYNVIETFDTITAMASKGVIVTPQILTVKFRVTLTHYSENSNILQVYVRAKDSDNEWKIVMLNGVGTDYIFVGTDESGRLEYYLEESAFYDYKDDETGEEWYHCYGYVKANIQIDQVYLPFD